MKKKRVAVSCLVVLMLLVTSGLYYWTGFSHARKAPPVIVALDTADSPQPSAKAEYEPYFTKENHIPRGLK